MNWYSPKLRDNIKKASLAGDLTCTWPLPHACNGGTPGTIVGAHSNQLSDGKGKGIKAHDYRQALICSNSHYELDQGSKLEWEQKVIAFEIAHRRSIGQMFEVGIVRAA